MRKEVTMASGDLRRRSYISLKKNISSIWSYTTGFSGSSDSMDVYMSLGSGPEYKLPFKDFSYPPIYGTINGGSAELRPSTFKPNECYNLQFGGYWLRIYGDKFPINTRMITLRFVITNLDIYFMFDGDNTYYSGTMSDVSEYGCSIRNLQISYVPSFSASDDYELDDDKTDRFELGKSDNSLYINFTYQYTYYGERICINDHVSLKGEFYNSITNSVVGTFNKAALNPFEFGTDYR